MPTSNGQGTPVFVAKFYTGARRYPLVIGKLDDRFRLPGGPYTLPQAGVFAVAVTSMVAAKDVWARFGAVGNTLLILLVPWALAWLIRRARIDGRSPMSALRGLGRYYTNPPGGRLRGRPFSLPEPHTQHGRVWIHATELLPAVQPIPRPVVATSASERRPEDTAEPARQAGVSAVAPTRLQELLAGTSGMGERA